MSILKLIVVLSTLALASAIGAEDLAFLQSKNGFDYCPGSFASGEWVAGECSGREQSPIDLPAMTGTPAPANAIAATAGAGSQCTVENNGHTLKYECAAGSLGSFAFRGATFNIKQFHVHFPSEHTFGNQKKDGEVHFVAFKSTAKPSALVRGDAIALGAMVDITNNCAEASPLFTQIGMLTAPANPSTKPCARVKVGASGNNPSSSNGAAAAASSGISKALNPAAAPPSAAPSAAAPLKKMMFRSLSQSMNKVSNGTSASGHSSGHAPAPKASVANINLGATFAALSSSSTAQYEGSLTTPPCNQVVTHVVIVDKYLKVCRNVVDKFTLEQVGVNARPVQNANGRTPVYGLFTAGGAAAAASPATAPSTPAAAAPPSPNNKPVVSAK